MPGIRPSNLVAATLWMIVATTSFLGLMVGVRQLSTSMTVFEMLTLRSAIAFGVLMCFAGFLKQPIFKTTHLKLHLVRNVFHFSGQFCWAVGVVLLSLSEVIAIEFTTPIWSFLLAVVFLHERLTVARVAVLVAGFVGVCIIVRPGFQEIQGGTIVVFIAAICFALTTFITKKLTRDESVWSILLYMSILQFLIGLGPSLYYWVWPVGVDYFWIFVIGVCGLSAHLGLTKALSLADTATILPLDYLRLPATILIGYLFYQEAIDNLVVLGASIIFAANYFHLRQESRN